MHSAPDNGPTCGIFVSGMGLGHYIPGIMIADTLEKAGVKTILSVFENSLSETKQAMISNTRDHYQKNMHTAKIGHKMHHVLNTNETGSQNIQNLAAPKSPIEVDDAFLFSGQWCSEIGKSIIAKRVHLIHVDVVEAPSWETNALSVKKLLDEGAQDYWLSRPLADSSLLLLHSEIAPVNWEERQDRLLIHGGGWALGSLDDVADIALKLDWKVYLFLGNRPASSNPTANMVQFFSPSEWSPWTAPRDKPYPPLFEKNGNDILRPYSDGSQHELLKLASKSKAILSKPGGMGLAESLMTATPILFLEPLGPHEQKNADLWKGLGFAMFLDEWLSSNTRDQHLEQMHFKLVAAQNDATSLFDLIEVL